MARNIWHGVELRRICSLLLLAVFLAAQTVSLAHDVGHDPGGHDDACLTCHISKSADVALAPATPTLPLLIAAGHFPDATAGHVVARDGRAKNIRAPPGILIV